MTVTVLRKFSSALILLWVAFGLVACGGFLPKSSDSRHNQPLPSAVQSALRSMGSSPGEAMVVRIFKQEKTLEVWKKTSGGYKMFKTYEICAFSGELGPKVKEGDRQSPEGFYTITPGLLNMVNWRPGWHCVGTKPIITSCASRALANAASN